MQITKTTHPPAGATALLPVTDAAVWAMGWYYLPVVLLSSVLVLASALLVNNMQRRYPVFWWTPLAQATAPQRAAAKSVDLEKNASSDDDAHVEKVPETK